MTERLFDPRNPHTHLIAYPLADRLRTNLMLLGQGWRDQDNADGLRRYPNLEDSAGHKEAAVQLRGPPKMEPRSIACSAGLGFGSL